MPVQAGRRAWDLNRRPFAGKKAIFWYVVILIVTLSQTIIARVFVASEQWDGPFPESSSGLVRLLRAHANENKFVLLAAITFSYKDMFMNFLCNIDRLGIRGHLVLAAFDEKVYDWGIQQNLPIFLVQNLADKNQSLIQGGRWNTTEMEGGTFNSPAFKSASKAKTLATLQVLEAGYSVVWSDVDIVWFENPFEALSSCMSERSAICIQSDIPLGKSNPSNDLNSGMYVAPSSPLVKAAFRDIVDHQTTSTQSQQKSFNKVLCASPSIKLKEVCIYRPSPKEEENLDPSVLAHLLPVKILDRLQYPNGAVRVGKKRQDVFQLGTKKFSNETSKKVVMAHNNWVVGLEKKHARQVSAGWWFIDENGKCQK